MSAARRDTRRTRKFQLIRGITVNEDGEIMISPSVLRRPIIGQGGGRRRRYCKAPLKWTAYEECWAKLAVQRARDSETAFREQIGDVEVVIAKARFAAANERLTALVPQETHQLVYASY